MLAIAAPSEPLSLYISATDKAIAAVLIKEDNNQQKPIYYVSQVLKDAETRYPSVEKLALSLFVASRKLRHYFQGREIRVVTNQPLRAILHRPETSGRMIKWAMELSQYNIKYKSRTAIKAQALSDFIVECSFLDDQKESPPPCEQEKTAI